MKNILYISTIIISALISAFVLLQAQGTGLGGAWSGGGETYHTRRGLEKIVFYLTIISIFIFAGLLIFIIGS